MLLLLALLAAAPQPADLAVLGVVVPARDEAGVAVLRARGQTRVAGVGESAFGGRVTAIALDRVSLDFDGQPVELRLRPVARAAAPSAASPSPATARTDPRARAMSRDEVLRRLSDETPRIMAETSIENATDSDGAARGVALKRLPSGASLLTDAGLRPGDVLVEINGIPVDSIQTLAGLYARLQGESQLTAVVLRDGRPVTLSVSLR